MLFLVLRHITFHTLYTKNQNTQLSNKPQQVILFREMLSSEPVEHASHTEFSEHVTYIQLMLECCAGTFVSVCRDSNCNLTSVAWESCPHFCLRRGRLPPCAPACACTSLEVRGVTASIKSTSLLFSGNASVWPQQQPRYCSGNVSKELLRQRSEAKATNHAQKKYKYVKPMLKRDKPICSMYKI